MKKNKTLDELKKDICDAFHVSGDINTKMKIYKHSYSHKLNR